MPTEERRFFGMDQSNLIQLLLALAAIIGILFAYNEFIANNSRELQQIIDVENQLKTDGERRDKKLDQILDTLESINGRVDRHDSDIRLNDYRITEIERGLEQ